MFLEQVKPHSYIMKQRTKFPKVREKRKAMLFRGIGKTQNEREKGELTTQVQEKRENCASSIKKRPCFCQLIKKREN